MHHKHMRYKAMTYFAIDTLKINNQMESLSGIYRLTRPIRRGAQPSKSRLMAAPSLLRIFSKSSCSSAVSIFHLINARKMESLHENTKKC